MRSCYIMWIKIDENWYDYEFNSREEALNWYRSLRKKRLFFKVLSPHFKIVRKFFEND